MQRQLDKVLLHTSHSFGVGWLRQLLTAIFKVQGVCVCVLRACVRVFSCTVVFLSYN